MNCFLLMASCTMDDIPVKLYPTLAAAIKAAKRRAVPSANVLMTWDKAAPDASSFVCWKVVEFKNSVPVYSEIADGAQAA